MKLVKCKQEVNRLLLPEKEEKAGLNSWRLGHLHMFSWDFKKFWKLQFMCSKFIWLWTIVSLFDLVNISLFRGYFWLFDWWFHQSLIKKLSFLPIFCEKLSLCFFLFFFKVCISCSHSYSTNLTEKLKNTAESEVFWSLSYLQRELCEVWQILISDVSLICVLLGWKFWKV